MSVLQSGRCKGAGHTLALTLIWLHKGEKTAEQAGRQASMESYPPKKAHRVKICQTISMLPSQRGLPVVHKGEEGCPCAVGAPICCGGQGCCTRLPVCMLYFFGTPLSLQHSVWQSRCAHTMQERKCQSLPPTLAKGIPKPHRCTWLSWSRALVSVWSNSAELELAEFRIHPRLSGVCVSERQGKLSAGVL